MIRYKIAISNVGNVLMITNHRGLSLVAFDDDINKLNVELEQYLLFNRGQIHINIDDKIDFDEILKVINGEIECSFPLDVVGSEFQKLVWHYINTVKSGDTITYEQLAIGINHPKSFRAVANACGSNNLVIVIPCHRVVGKLDIGGYRWGVNIKQRLLDREKKVSVNA